MNLEYQLLILFLKSILVLTAHLEVYQLVLEIILTLGPLFFHPH